ncbi:MAG TPA: hypothetical protein QGG27_06295 [Acidimicrobiales bacterium]|jgi:hypothetical protein|nr:hypothetical protein [Acidimicrobiales bacterium]HJO41441.1 hypothetical protein [Acidimicrobiales bacterium]|tara:strand:- start:198 stop:623 length:426 start_codon:yes stop_codon:yes gene_type:complete
MLILLGLGALWAAVLLPPIIRNQISTRSSAPGIANHLDVYSVPAMKGYSISLPQSAVAAKRRRRDVAIVLSGVVVFTFLTSLAVGGIFLWTVHFVVDLALVGYVTLITQRSDLATGETSVVLTHSFIANSMEEEYSYPEAI